MNSSWYQVSSIPVLTFPLLSQAQPEKPGLKLYNVNFEAPERHRKLKLARIALWKNCSLTLWPSLLAKTLQGLHPGTVTFITAWKVHESDTWLQKIASHWGRDILPLRPSVPDHCHLELLRVPGVFWTQNIISLQSSRDFRDERRAEPLHLSPQPGCIWRYLAKERSLTLMKAGHPYLECEGIKMQQPHGSSQWNNATHKLLTGVRGSSQVWTCWAKANRLPSKLTLWHYDRSKLTYKQAHSLRVWLCQGEN